MNSFELAIQNCGSAKLFILDIYFPETKEIGEIEWFQKIMEMSCLQFVK